MRYGAITLMPEYGSVTIVKKQRQITRHYIDTDRSDSINLGRQATEISCTLLARDDNERITLEQLFHSGSEQELHFRDTYYKRVKVHAEYQMHPASYESQAKWRFDVSFICLDPIPYSRDTDEAMY